MLTRRIYRVGERFRKTRHGFLEEGPQLHTHILDATADLDAVATVKEFA